MGETLTRHFIQSEVKSEIQPCQDSCSMKTTASKFSAEKQSDCCIQVTFHGPRQYNGSTGNKQPDIVIEPQSPWVVVWAVKMLNMETCCLSPICGPTFNAAFLLTVIMFSNRHRVDISTHTMTQQQVVFVPYVDHSGS